MSNANNQERAAIINRLLTSPQEFFARNLRLAKAELDLISPEKCGSIENNLRRKLASLVKCDTISPLSPSGINLLSAFLDSWLKYAITERDNQFLTEYSISIASSSSATTYSELQSRSALALAAAFAPAPTSAPAEVLKALCDVVSCNKPCTFSASVAARVLATFKAVTPASISSFIRSGFQLLLSPSSLRGPSTAYNTAKDFGFYGLKARLVSPQDLLGFVTANKTISPKKLALEAEAALNVILANRGACKPEDLAYMQSVLLHATQTQTFIGRIVLSMSQNSSPLVDQLFGVASAISRMQLAFARSSPSLTPAPACTPASCFSFSTTPADFSTGLTDAEREQVTAGLARTSYFVESSSEYDPNIVRSDELRPLALTGLYLSKYLSELTGKQIPSFRFIGRYWFMLTLLATWFGYRVLTAESGELDEIWEE